MTTRNTILTHSDLGIHQIALLYETMGRMRWPGDPTTANVQSDLEYIAENYFGHPNYFYIDGKPVIFVYLTRGLYNTGLLDRTVSLMRKASASKGYDEVYIVGDHAFGNPPPPGYYPPFDMLDAVTTYGIYGPLSAGNTYAEQHRVDTYYDKQDSWRVQAQAQNCGFIPSVIPGYNDRAVRPEVDHHPLSRKLNPGADFGSLFQASLKLAISQVDPIAGNVLMVNSWNEWHEDTQIEPTVGPLASEPFDYTQGLEYEGFGDLYLRILQRVTTGGGDFVSEVEITTSAPTPAPTPIPSRVSQCHRWSGFLRFVCTFLARN
jgi:hypothetical protein